MCKPKKSCWRCCPNFKLSSIPFCGKQLLEVSEDMKLFACEARDKFTRDEFRKMHLNQVN